MVAAWLRSPFPEGAVPLPGGPPGEGREPGGWDPVVFVLEPEVDVDEGAVRFGGSNEANVLDIGNGLFLPWAWLNNENSLLQLKSYGLI